LSTSPESNKYQVIRVQTGVRIEVRMLKVLKALAEYFDMTLGDLLEGILLHTFEGKCAITDEKTLQVIATLKEIYGIDYDASASHRMFEGEVPEENVERTDRF
jgi:hypothetical protein